MASSIDKISIKLWAEDDRPREKLLLKGKHSLSNAEILAILISTGTKEESAVDLGKKILAACSNNLNDLAKFSVSDLKKIRGIGDAKAISIIAALEIGRRRNDEDAKKTVVIKSSKHVAQYFHSLMCDLKHEEFWILLLAKNNKVIARKKISEGGISGTVADLKIIFKHAVDELASGLILCHNHPSGNIQPSESDIKLTKQTKEAAKLMDITLQDHIILGENELYYSFADEGII